MLGDFRLSQYMYAWLIINKFHFYRFYIGCDLCSNWYHGECVGITEKEAKNMDDYICMECKRAQEGSSEELYCICRTPYDESQYVMIICSFKYWLKEKRHKCG